MRGTVLAALAVTAFVVLQVTTGVRLSAGGWAALGASAALAILGDALRRHRPGVGAVGAAGAVVPPAPAPRAADGL